MSALKRRRARLLARESYWNGFFAALGGMIGRDPGQFAEGPRWWEEVKNIASEAGFEYGKRLVDARKNGEPSRIPLRDIPADVLANCYAAATR